MIDKTIDKTYILRVYLDDNNMWCTDVYERIKKELDKEVEKNG